MSDSASTATRPQPQPGFFSAWLSDWFKLRKPASLVESVLLSVLCVLLCLAAWWLLTLGETESRWIGPLTMPSPREAFEAAPELFRSTEFLIVANTLVTLRRVALGFLLAIVVGVPLGVLAGCFPRLNSFLAPLVMFGRNIPVAAILPLLIFLFNRYGGEQRKVLFIFVACVAFVIADATRAILDVHERYVDTAYTLGANRWQTIIKVLVPLAMPTIFGSFRVLFGLAFGYIMFAESIKDATHLGGLGYQIDTFRRRSLREYTYLIILIIPLVALAVDLVLFWIQRQLFPHVYGGPGWLNKLVRLSLHGWDDLKRVFFQIGPQQPVPTPPAPSAAPPPGPTGASAAGSVTNPKPDPPPPT